MKSALLVLVASFAALSSATWVVQCYSRLYDQRMDPIVNPDQVSPHVHVIAGGNGFGFTMDFQQARSSKCSTCNIREDLSNYWTPKLYYHAQNGSFISVPIEGDQANGNVGGIAIYYLHRPGPDNDVIHPFPDGFRMVAGDPRKRNLTDDFAARAVRHRCIGKHLEQQGFPSIKCPGGIRLQVVFPACWDGKNLDSPDHKSHVSYPKDGNFDGGRCPDTHPVHLMTLFFEVTYRTDMFADMWYGNEQPFVLSNGDPTGYSFHGDFVNGWDNSTLQRAITDCVDGTPTCPDTHFTFRSQGETQACKLPAQVNEQVNGVLPALPGCNPVSYNASRVSSGCATQPSGTMNPATNSVPLGVPDLTQSKGWKYVGCGTDDWDRTLKGAMEGTNDMTVEMCVDFCTAKGFSWAGLEYASECYCGSTLPAYRAPKPGLYGNCLMKCKGNANEYCGGPMALSIFQACGNGDNATCTNANPSANKIKRDRLGRPGHGMKQGLRDMSIDVV